MKKLISLCMALALVLSLGTVAFAAETVGTGSYDQEVTGTYVPGTTASGTIFSVEIAWAGLSFTYHAEKAPVWDPVGHVYSETEEAYWEGEGTITITNHSNAKISATPVFNKATGYDDVVLKFSSTELKVGSAAAVNAAVVGTITVTPEGSLPEINNESKSDTIGTITVTIAEDTDVTMDEIRALKAEAEALLSAVDSAHHETDAYKAVQEGITQFNQIIETYEWLESGEEATWGPDTITWDDFQEEHMNYEYPRLVEACNALRELAGL